MFSHRFDQAPSKFVVAHWFMLSFNAGCINAGGFLATGRFVSHVTGFATLFGVDLANHQYSAAIGILSVPLFFLIGATIAGLLIDRQIYFQRRPHFDYVMGLSALCLFAASTGGGLTKFAGFNELIHLKQIYVLLSLLCLACGLQNAAITSASGSSIRTTHLTGLTTDLGLGIARLFTYHVNEPGFRREVRSNELRIGSILSFIGGSAVGSWFFIKWGYAGFFFAGLITAYAAWHGHREKQIPHKLDPV